MDEIKGIPTPIEDTENPIKIYNVKVGDKFYYVDVHGKWIDVAEIRKIDVFNRHQRIFVRTFITNRSGQVLDKRTPQNSYYLWPEDKDKGMYGRFLFRTQEEAYQFLIDYVKADMERVIEDLKNQAKRHNIPLNPCSAFPQIESRKD